MQKKSVWLMVMVILVAIAFIATGCAKKQTVKEEAASKSAASTAPTPAPPAPTPAPEAAAPAPTPAPAPEPQVKVETATPAPAAELNLKEMTIWFAFDDYNLSTNSKEKLEKIANWMSKNSAAKVQVQGNTCDIGTAEYNLALGEKRAVSAKKYLEGLGVNASRINTISYGEERPSVPNANEGNRSKNRRDEFVAVP
jgi:peptidoglycan-associated lipoprotein